METMSVESFLELPASTTSSSSTVRVHRFMDKEYLLSEHEYWLNGQLSLEELRCSFSGLELTSTAPPPPAAAATCSASTSEVELIAKNLITLSALSSSIDQVLDGKFLLCRTIAPPIKMTTALTTVVDDPEGILAAKLALYNFDKCNNIGFTCSLEQCSSILPVGTILAIKNPLLKLSMEDGGGEMGIRCDNSTNVVIMDAEALEKLNPDLKWNGEIPSEYINMKIITKEAEAEIDAKTAETCKFYKEFGDALFGRGEYAAAIHAYTCGLTESKHEDSVLLSHRSMAYSIIGKFEEALADAQTLPDMDSLHQIGIVEKTRALWDLKQFRTAKEYLETQILPAIQYDVIFIRKCPPRKAEELISQATSGNYPMEMHQIGNQFSTRPLHLAEYDGEIMVRDTCDGRSRGLYAKKDIAAAELMLARKAFAYVISKKNGGNGGIVPSKNRSATRQRFLELISAFANILKHNPRISKFRYKLYAGPELKFLSQDHPASTFIDMSRIDAIYNYNAFCHNPPLNDNDYYVTGIWIQPSFTNHGCCIGCNIASGQCMVICYIFFEN